MNRYTAVFIVLMVANYNVLSADDGPTFKVGTGVRSCAQFVKEYKQSRLIEEIYFVWTQGYLTGVNIMSIRRGEVGLDLVPKGMSIDWQKSYLRDYCSQNPLSPYSEATASLLFEIVKANKRQ
jgi:hypothetical protein